MTSGRVTSAWAPWSLIINELILNAIPGYLGQKETQENHKAWQRFEYIVNSGRLCSHLLVKKPKPSFCNALQSLILLKEVSEHFPSSLFPVDQPIGLYHIDNHIWNFSLKESGSCSSWNIHALFTYWNGCGENPVRPFTCMRAAFGSANIKTERIQRCLHRSGERRSPLNTMPGLSLPADSGEYGISGRQGNPSCSQ